MKKEGREISEEILIQKAKNGNDHAFRVLVEKYRNDVFRVIFAVLRDHKEAEDACQEVFIKVFTSLPNYQGEGFKTWISRIAVNHSIDVKRKRERRREEIVEVVKDNVLMVERDHLEKDIVMKEDHRRIREKIESMPENYRDVIYGFYIAEKSYQQMAIEQNVQVKTIETKLYRARHWMKQHWKEEDFL